MAETTGQSQTQHEEKTPATNGSSNEQHEQHAAENTNGGQNGETTATPAAEAGAGAAACESCPIKKRSVRVKEFLTRIFKHGKKDESGQNGEPKKEKAKKEKAATKKDEVKAGSAEQPQATTETEKPAADTDCTKLASQTESALKIEDCVEGAKHDSNGHSEKGKDATDEKTAEKSVEQVDGNAEKRSDEKHDC